MSQNFSEDNVDLLLIEEEGKIHYVLIKHLNIFLHDYTLHSRRKHFCCHCLQAFRTAETLKCHIKDCFKIKSKQRIKIPKKVNLLDSKIMKEKQYHHL